MPKIPTTRELSDDELAQVAGGEKKQDKPKETKEPYFKIKLKPVLVTSYSAAT